MNNMSKTPNMSNSRKLANSTEFAGSKPMLDKSMARSGISTQMLLQNNTGYGKGKHAAKVGGALQSATSYNGLFDISYQRSPTRGTLFRSTASGMPTYWHETVGPQFDASTSVFSVNNNDNFASRGRMRMSAETLSRLGLKPAHKPIRSKYDSSNRTH